jgi:diguanylate cyclase (GGDEF)-like protein
MLDVDFFKTYNDYYGHPAGDDVLRAVGGVLKQFSVDENVFVARVGGEEFLAIWTENRVTEAERLALKLRQNIIDLNIPHIKSAIAPYVTASIGLYIMRGGAEDTATQLYQNVDLALYKAKESGRNCIVALDSSVGTTRFVDLRPPENVKRVPFPVGKFNE